MILTHESECRSLTKRVVGHRALSFTLNYILNHWCILLCIPFLNRANSKFYATILTADKSFEITSMACELVNIFTLPSSTVDVPCSLTVKDFRVDSQVQNIKIKNTLHLTTFFPIVGKTYVRGALLAIFKPSFPILLLH